MFSDKTLNEARQGMKQWIEEVKGLTGDFQGGKQFSTISNLEIEPIYTPENIKDVG